MNEQEQLERLVRLEAVQEELRRNIDRVEAKDDQERMSLLATINDTAEEIVKAMTLLTGDNGENGLCSKVRRIEAAQKVAAEDLDDSLTQIRQEQREHHASIRRWIAGLVSTIIAAVIIKWVLQI